jgi:exonuclease SbcC
LRILHLTSLAGEFTIDFTHPAYRGGVFAITGPTGAGKTTILDAICLALYGRTPRLPRINKGGNEIMSRSRGECAAEVTFETPAGRWRASWAQRRARLKAGGPLQDPRHEIAEAGGRLLESQLSRTAARIAALTGLTFEQFTRASLLAQGAFAAFLAAPADDKAALLEQITGTALYRDISIRVHQRRAEERRRLEDLEKAGAVLAAPAPGEDEAGLRLRRAELAGRLESLEGELASGGEARAWLQTLAGLEEERDRLAAKEKELAGRRQAFTPLAERLERANLALPLAPLGAELALLRQQRAAAIQSLFRGGPNPAGSPGRRWPG